MVRLTTEIWVSAYLVRLGAAHIPTYVTAKGDATAGAVLVKCATLDGNADLWAREPGPNWEPVWTRIKRGPEAEIDAAAAKRRDADPDLWVLELEDRAGRTLLEDFGLA
ncbi:DUF1491 family protein [Rhodovulum sp. DZ06]|uniref:DUF1491 family protein n=1 Tax=Rhodovulum sp. DZ06 TaxID=3425126 RepID=UPI003D33E5FB